MIRILVVDDSAFSRKVITRILESIPDVQIADTACDGQEAISKTLRVRPDLITLDLEMPNMDGFTFLRWIMKSAPTPVIVVSSKEADENVFKAMDLGALDFVMKPTRHPSMELEEIKANLIEKVLAVPLFAQKRTKEKMQIESLMVREQLTRAIPAEKPLLIAIGSSTGGPPAIQTILRELPSGFDVPLVIAQHMPRTFTALFAERLNQHTSLHVKEAAQGEILKPGFVYIAPGGAHLLIHRNANSFGVEIRSKEDGIRYQPSADLLFESVAHAAGAQTIATVLTGMGDDGCKGLTHVKSNQGITIAESERTAVIFGMPQQAIRAGVVDHILPLSEIAAALKTLCRMV
jgi:two-component system, chemotaxis family, protein-glutamate methylesterase/glutaminase